MLMNIWIRNNSTGEIRQVGTDIHDSLEFFDGKIEYVNMQCMTGTIGGDYSFVEAPADAEAEGYIAITPEQFMMNKKMIHKDLLKALGLDENNIVIS